MMLIFVIFSFTNRKTLLLILVFLLLGLCSLLDELCLPIISPVTFDGFLVGLDEYRLALTYMILAVFFFSLLTYYQGSKDSNSSFILLWSLICLIIAASSLVFYSSRLLAVYIGYEMSLIPIILIIYGWGSYPERAYSALVMLLYTLFFSLPLLVFFSLIWFIDNGTVGSLITLVFTTIPPVIPVFTLSLFIFLAFAVKLPVYGLHSWLPLAHVEAPTFGSMILAGLLLKLGGCGLYRFRIAIPSLRLDLSPYFFSYLILSIVVSSVITSVQSDLKRLIAYSSVVHITRVGLLFLLGNKLALRAALILIVIHGISSPLIFYIVGEVYQNIHTRSLLLIRSLKVYFPLLYFRIIVVFFLTVPVPPSLTFLGEIFLFVSLLKHGWVLAIFGGLYLFMAIIFNLVWLTSFFGRSQYSQVINSRVLSIYIPVAMVLMGCLAGFILNSLFL